MTIRVAVLSDAHVGSKARAGDLRPEGPTDRDLPGQYCEKFIEFVKNNAVIADYLFVPGDVSEVASPTEFRRASEVILQVAASLRVPEDRILFVPGNHDVNWAAMRAYPGGPASLVAAQRFAALRHNDWIFDRLMDEGSRHLCVDPFFRLWQFDDVLVVGFNSSSAIEPEPATTPNHGMISEASLNAIDSALAAVSGQQRVRLFLLHHHPVLYRDPVEWRPDFDLMTNGPALMSLLQSHRFDYVVHGHKHAPSFQVHDLDAVHPLPMLCAGSFSAEIRGAWAGVVTNQFHVVQIERRAPDSGHALGVTRSWSYTTARGWEPSRTLTGVLPEMGFGFYPTVAALSERISSLLKRRLATSTFVDWPDVVAEDEMLRYVPVRLIEAALEELESTGGITLRGPAGSWTVIRT